jgi:hypothetical protein
VDPSGETVGDVVVADVVDAIQEQAELSFDGKFLH